jgi:hypothetical protein
LDPVLASQMDAIQQQVTALRGLQPIGSVPRAVMNQDQLRERVINDFFKDYTPEEAAADVRFLSALGLLKPGFDLSKLYIDLYSEQIAGFYDPETKEMYVVSGSNFSGIERMTYAHEYTHVLQDQNYDLMNGLKRNPDYCEDHSEYCAAVDALAEGDATLTEQLWLLQNSTTEDKQDIQDFYANYTSPVYDSAPEFLKQDFLYPYQNGMDFVSSLFQKGGWQAVDDAYRNPPVSTAQILHPELYPAVAPLPVDLPDLAQALGAGWEETDRDVIGEWYTYLVLSAGIDPATRLDDQAAADAAAGWAGDAYSVVWNPERQQQVVVWASQWNDAAETSQFWQALQDWAQTRWGSPASQSAQSLTWQTADAGQVLLRQKDNQVWLLISPDAAAASTLQQVLPVLK